ncbi:MAG: dual specificity protein phosphatase family protein [Candidatus Eisenbacteria sp.]|nr:dual specificity protein phosphatase family protein [Candidatus Eisenbacteria bacterium]
MKTPPPYTYWILPGKVLGGPYPGAHSTDELPPRLFALLDFGISCFLDLTEPGECDTAPYVDLVGKVARSSGRELEYRSRPIFDFAVAAPEFMSEIIDTLDDLLASGHRIYLHCFAGVGRTAMVGGCYLVHRGMAPEAALAVLNSDEEAALHGGAYRPATAAQRALIEEWPRHDGEPVRA